MNIKKAKEYIKDTVSIYLKRDEYGELDIPVVKQRPIFLLGAPGVGKTAIMEQVASELNIALCSYAMTHHTRQSALGLPVIKDKVYGGITTQVTEYTMSEIIASIYNVIEESGISEGILFLDEINCVSETLAPSMLQFLQYKEFGNHRIPDGWVVVTAGNPPEFNKQVREFDVVVMDRLKVIEVEPEYSAFREYAYDRNVHPAIISFLDIKKEYFYLIENTVKGRSYVTARGWEDLSQILLRYEEAGLSVDETLIEQYIRNTKVVKEFAAYYDIYKKYKRDYGVEDIFDGKYSAQSVEKASKASFDERLSLLGILMDGVLKSMKESVVKGDNLSGLAKVLKVVIGKSQENGFELYDELMNIIAGKRKQLLSLDKAGISTTDSRKTAGFVISFIENEAKKVSLGDGDIASIKVDYNDMVIKARKQAEEVSNTLHNVFDFVAKAFEKGNEMLIFVTNLTVNEYASVYLTRFPSDDYNNYRKEMMVEERNDSISAMIDEVL